MGIIPDGWNDYERIGKQIHGTRFIAFKVPLKEILNVSGKITEEKQLYPKLLVKLLPKLGMVVDLTNTHRYYVPEEFLKLGVEHEKIQVEGHQIPSNDCFYRFRDAVERFLSENADNDKLIGVHCTHGLNRTGFLVCRYMIEQMKIAPLEAIATFEVARGHKIERNNYTDQLKRFGKQFPSLSIDSECDKGTQTRPVFCIEETSIRAIARKSNELQIQTDNSDKQNMQQVALTGYVNVQRSDLIPDGRGGYFVHVQRKDISRFDANQHSQYQPHQIRSNYPNQPAHNMDMLNRGAIKRSHLAADDGNKWRSHDDRNVSHRFHGLGSSRTQTSAPRPQRSADYARTRDNNGGADHKRRKF